MSRPKDMSATPTVAAVGQMNFEGNIIPHNWYKTITYANGKPHMNAIIILAEIVYWYRPTTIKDEAKGQVVSMNRKFHGDLLQRTYQSFADQFGLSKGQVTDALKCLEEQGVVTRVFRTVRTDMGMVLPNILFIDLHVERLKEVTYPVTEQPMSGSEETHPPIGQDISPAETADITEITTENTTESSHKITHHHHREDGGGDLGGGGEHGAVEDGNLKLKQELAFELLQYIAPTFNNTKRFIENLSSSALDGLGAWIILIGKDSQRQRDLTNIPGYLRSQIAEGQYPDQPEIRDAWQRAMEIYMRRKDWEDVCNELGLYAL